MADTPSPDVPGSTGPVPVKDRRRSNPSRATQVIVGTAVAVLPASQRRRYALEFLAELHEVGRPAQLNYALGLLAHSWGLRLALKDTNSETEGAPTMHKPLRCVLHLHHNVVRRNYEFSPPARYYECTRCGRQRDVPTPTYPPGAM